MRFTELFAAALSACRVATQLLGVREQKSGIIKESQQAEFNQGFYFKLGDTWESETVKICVDDTKKSRHLLQK